MKSIKFLMILILIKNHQKLKNINGYHKNVVGFIDLIHIIENRKTVISNQFLSNKIETLNKTVTFYKSSSPSSSIFDSRSRSVSRGPSTRSMNSFASVSEEVNEEDENLEENEGGGDENYSELIKEVNGDTNFGFRSPELV